jgi:hypothetical protein
MFCDCNTLYWAMQEWIEGPDCDFYDDLDADLWVGFLDWSDAEFDAAVDARQAWLFMALDTRPLEQRPDYCRASFRSPIAPSSLFQARVAAHRSQEQQDQQQPKGSSHGSAQRMHPRAITGDRCAWESG